MIDNEKFIHIEDYKNDTLRIVKEINNKIEKLEDIYKEYLDEAVKKEEYIMSLDVLFYQIELTKKDIDNYNDLFNSFLSRVYGQYYKLFTKINNSLGEEFINDYITHIVEINDFIPYDDLNEKKYSWEDITRLHNTINSILNQVNTYISRQKCNVDSDEVRIKRGINITHLVYQKTHDIEILSQEIKLFNGILINYYEYQKKFLRRLMLKLKLLFLQIDSDIQFETVTYTIDETNTNDKLEKILLKELDISHSPIKRKNNTQVNRNFFTVVYGFLAKRLMWLICLD